MSVFNNPNDKFAEKQRPNPINAPAENMLALTPNDTVVLTTFSRGLHCNTAGTVVVQPVGAAGTAVNSATWVTLALNAGVLYPYRISMLANAGGATTAGVVAVW